MDIYKYKMGKWGFLRETTKKAKKEGIDKETGWHRTGLDEYLKIIFPTIDDWVHDKQLGEISGKRYKIRPDYRSEALKLIIEFDGFQHYTNPDIIEKDIENTKIYQKFGYKVVRIPYFIQLTNMAVKTLFNVNVSEYLFNEKIPSLSIKWRNTPAYLCHAGIQRMAMDFKGFPEQYEVNLNFLEKENNSFKSGVELLENAYNALLKKKSA